MSNFDRIAISGKMCSGKTTVAKLLQQEYDYSRLFFAEELKTLCKDIANYNRAYSSGLEIESRKPLMEVICQDIERITDSEEEFAMAMTQVLEIMEDYKDVTYYDPTSDKKTDRVRQMLQDVGTERMRNNVNDKIWVNALEKQILHTEKPKIVVDDLRNENEFAMLRKRGFVTVRLNISKETQIQRLKKLYGRYNESKLSHFSETQLDYIAFDYVIDSDQDLESMLNDVQTMIGG